MRALIAKKVGMTRIFAENGSASAVTLLDASPNIVVQIKTKDKEGYEAVQLGFGSRRAKTVNKPMIGHVKKSGHGPFTKISEIDVETLEGVTVGQEVKADIFTVGEVVDVIATSKGLGFQGVVRLHNFRGGPVSHGQSDRLRAPGSVGASSYPSRTFKGQRMAGRMGGKRVTTKNMKILLVDMEHNVIGIEGSIPGKNNSFVKIRKK